MNDLYFGSMRSRASVGVARFREWAQQFLKRWQRRRLARAQARSLAQLDDSVLRDLGVGRSEIQSLMWEVHGLAQAQRLAALNSLAQRSD